MNKRRRIKLGFEEEDAEDHELIGEKSGLPPIAEFEKEEEGNSKQSSSTNNTFITNQTFVWGTGDTNTYNININGYFVVYNNAANGSAPFKNPSDQAEDCQFGLPPPPGLQEEDLAVPFEKIYPSNGWAS